MNFSAAPERAAWFFLMSVLVVQIPPRRRLGLRTQAEAQSPGSLSWAYALSSDGETLSDHGQRLLAELPRADRVVATLAPQDVSWHQVNLPKVPVARLRPALLGLMEEQLLTEAEHTHLALKGPASATGPQWVAAVHEPSLREALACLEAAGLDVDAVVPLACPGLPPRGHFERVPASNGQGESLQLSLSDDTQALSLPASRHWLSAEQRQHFHWSASPDAALEAEACLGQPVESVLPAQRLLQAAQAEVNLLQFHLLRKHRGTKALRELWRQALSPAWRPVRWGLVGVLGVSLVGLNLAAAQMQRQLQAQRLQAERVLKTAFPQVGGILDAPLQMQREFARLRAQSGVVGEDDLESALAAAALAWPAGQAPLERLRFERQTLALSPPSWDAGTTDAFRNALAAQGWKMEVTPGEWVLSRRASGEGVK
jgi:general secretion pathway protein L